MKLRFRNQLLLTLLVIFIPFVFLGGVLTYYQVKKDIQSNIENDLQVSLDSLAELVNLSVKIFIKNQADPIDLKKIFSSFRLGKNTHVCLLNENKKLIVQTFDAKEQATEFSDQSSSLLEQILEKKNGKIHYFTESSGKEKIVVFRYLPEFKWILTISIDEDQIYEPLTQLRNFLVLFVIIFSFLMVWVVFIVSEFVTKPLTNLMHTLEKGADGDYGVRIEEQGSTEFVSLCRHFNTFLQKLEENNLSIQKEIEKNIQSQKALVENDLKLRSLFDQSFHYVWMLSPSGTLEQMNQSAFDFTGVTHADVLFRPFWETVFWNHDSKISEMIRQSVEKAIKGELLWFETTCKTRENAVRDIDMSIKPAFLPSGDIAFIIVEGRDITDFKRTAHEKKDLAVQLERSRKMEAIGTLAGGIAHDFNNILSGILGYSQLAQINLERPARARSHIKQISQGIQRAAELTQQILTFSRQTEYEKQSLKIHIVVKEALKLLRSSLPATIEIKEIIQSKKMALADPTQMHQVVMNLCTNAYHAMIKTGGILTVQLRSVELTDERDVFDRKIIPGYYIEITVADTGCGMDSDTFSKAFDPYFTTKEVGKGTGFGLALVNAIVDEHNGYIKAQTAVGKGSSFSVYLPIIDSSEPQEKKDKEKIDVQSGTEHIMVVDDEEDIRRIQKEYLSSLGYQVSAFSDGAKAFEAFKAEPHEFDLMITDMTMPKMTGDVLSKNVLALRKDMPIILCTGYSETASEAQILETGVKKYIQKPIDNIKLCVLIRSLLDDALLQKKQF